MAFKGVFLFNYDAVIIVFDASASTPPPAPWSELGFGSKARDIESPVKRWVRELESAGERSKSNILGVPPTEASATYNGIGTSESGSQDDLSDLEGGGGGVSTAHVAPSIYGDSGGGRASEANGERCYGWVQRPCPERGLGCGGAPERTPMLVVGNKADLGVAALGLRDDKKRHSSRLQPHSSTNPHILLSATDPHLDTKGLHDFFHAAREIKLGNSSGSSNNIVLNSNSRHSTSKWREAAVSPPMRARADTDSGLVRAGSSSLGAESLDPTVGVHRVGSWGSSSSTSSGSSSSSSSSSGGSSRSDLLLRGNGQPFGTPERRHSGPHGGSSRDSSSSSATSNTSRSSGVGKGALVPEPPPISRAHAPSPGMGTRKAPAPAALPRLKEKEGKLS